MFTLLKVIFRGHEKEMQIALHNSCFYDPCPSENNNKKSVNEHEIKRTQRKRQQAALVGRS